MMLLLGMYIVLLKRYICNICMLDVIMYVYIYAVYTIFDTTSNPNPYLFIKFNFSSKKKKKKKKIKVYRCIEYKTLKKKM